MHRNITLVPTISSGTSGPLYVSEKQKGAGYYKSQNPIHTTVYTVTAGFRGRIKLQGTLVSDPVELDWADISETEVELNDTEEGAPETISIDTNFKGQYIWVRAVISDFTDGSLEKISYSYN